MVTLRWWQPEGLASRGRLYINGLPADGKCYLSLTRGAITLSTEDSMAEPIELLEVLKRELVQSGQLNSSQVDDWNALVSLGKGTSFRPTNRRAAPVESRPQEARSSHGLDITRIPLTVPIHIKVDHREPEAIVRLLQSVPKKRAEQIREVLAGFEVPT